MRIYFTIIAVVASTVLSQGQLFITSAPPNQLTSAWVSLGFTQSPDTNVSGYYLQWGFASGQCTNSFDIGNATNVTIGGLSINTQYYFAVVGHDSSGQLAAPSNELPYMPTNDVLPPTITTDITNQTVVTGSKLSFQIGISGTAPIYYEWLFNGDAIPGATTYSLTLDATTEQNAGSYQVIISNDVGSATSAVATLSFVLSPEGAPLLGATSNLLVLKNVKSSQSGIDQLIATHPVGSVTSAVAVLTVLAPPGIITDLTNQVAITGSDVAFQVGLTGTAPLSYQWLFNGSSIPGATTNPLVLKKASSQTAGDYQVIVTNSAGSTTSSVATLDVIDAGSVRIHAHGGNSYSLTLGGLQTPSYSVQYGPSPSGPWSVIGTIAAAPFQGLHYDAAGTNAFGFFRVVAP